MLISNAVTAKAAMAASTIVVIRKRRERGLFSADIIPPRCSRDLQRSSSVQVPYRGMTAGTCNPFGASMNIVGVNGLNNIFVTMPAGVFRHLAVKRGDLNVIRVTPRREVKRMKEAVHRLHGVFAGEVMRCVAVIASSRRAVAGLDPSVVLPPHHVAIGA